MMSENSHLLLQSTEMTSNCNLSGKFSLLQPVFCSPVCNDGLYLSPSDRKVIKVIDWLAVRDCIKRCISVLWPHNYHQLLDYHMHTLHITYVNVHLAEVENN